MEIIENTPVWGAPVDEDALKQIKACYYIFGQSAVMADHHKGYGVPIGGLIAHETLVARQVSATTPSDVLSQVHGNMPIKQRAGRYPGRESSPSDPIRSCRSWPEAHGRGFEEAGTQARTWEPPCELPPVSLRSRIAFAGRTDR
jgi:hypothetical protein